MKELIPFSDYEATTRLGTLRTALVMALLWGTPMTGYLWYARGSLAPATVLSIGIAGGLLFGFGWTLWMRVGTTKLLRRLYVADPALFPHLPSHFDAMLPASLMKGSIAVGGLLLLSPDTAQFVPHVKNLKRHQSPTQLRLDAAAEPRVVERTPNAFGRLFRPDPAQLLELRNEQDSMLLLVPTPNRVASLIREHTNSRAVRRTV